MSAEALEIPRPRILVCRDDDFKVTQALNPHAHPETVDPRHAFSQWEHMRSVLMKYADVEVAEFGDGTPQEIFWTRDPYGLVGDQVVLANFQPKERRPEVEYYESWFAKHDIPTVKPDGMFEGGNVVGHEGVYYMGTGYRGQAEDCDRLSWQLGKEFVGLEVVSADFFHLDVAMVSLGDHVMYYPQAFTPEALEILGDRLPDAIELSAEEVDGFCANSVALGDTVIMPPNQPTFRAKVEAIGKTAVEVDLSAFKPLGGGGVHCLTNSLPA